MLKNRSIVRTMCIGIALLVVAAIALGAGRSIGAGNAHAASKMAPFQLSVEGDCIIPRVRIIEIDNMVGRLDTTTGAIHVMQGDPSRGMGRVQWLPYVSGVGSSSGVLDIQQPRGVRGTQAVFLIDLVHGDTWVLRDRGVSANWLRVSVRR